MNEQSNAITHLIYGIWLNSSHAIPGLTIQPPILFADVRIHFGWLPSWRNHELESARLWHVASETDSRGEPLLRIWLLADGQYLRFLYADETEFVLERNGSQIWATWAESSTLEDTATYLLGPVLGFLLRLRGVVCLHASAVVVDNQAIALLGPAGTGKSTTAAAFAQLGYKVLSDDVVALSDGGSIFIVQPAYPRVRLWPSSVNILCGADDALPLLTPTWGKRYLDLQAGASTFQDKPLPLAALYLLGDRCDLSTAPFIENMPANEALMSLVANSYTNYLLDKHMRAAEFRVLGRILEQLRVKRVRPHTDPTRLSLLCGTICDDFRHNR